MKRFLYVLLVVGLVMVGASIFVSQESANSVSIGVGTQPPSAEIESVAPPLVETPNATTGEQGGSSDQQEVNGPIRTGDGKPDRSNDPAPTAEPEETGNVELRFAQSPREYALRIDAYIAESERDPEWSPVAEKVLGDLLQNSDEEVFIDCVADTCFADVYVSDTVFLTETRQGLYEWSRSRPDGFHASNFYVRDSGGFYRLYFFKDGVDLQTIFAAD